MSLLADLQDILGADNVLTGDDALPYLTDWRGRYTGKALAVVRPATVEEVADVVKLCQLFDTPMVTQGGNTGLCGGATPSNKGDAVVIVMTRLNKILHIDTENDTITVEAGCVLQTIQDAAEQVGRLFPLSLASEGSCTIGGNLATNAGGTQVLRYGNARDLTLGLQVVTAEGDIWNGLRGLRKDNTGYDLKNLFIGSEGTLGIITAATLKLYPLPIAQVTALLAFEDISTGIAILNRAKVGFGSSLTGFELISSYCMENVRRGLPEMNMPFDAEKAAWYALIEISDAESEQHARHLFEKVIQASFEAGELVDAVIAESQQQSQALWNIRESIPLVSAKLGQEIKHDISVPISKIAEFVAVTNAQLQALLPGVKHAIFGHLGDGNLHYNVAAPTAETVNFLDNQKDVYQIVFDSVVAFGGSISAEHGIGQLKKDLLLDYKDDVELALMRKVKRALDPHALFNPGKVISSVERY